MRELELLDRDLARLVSSIAVEDAHAALDDREAAKEDPDPIRGRDAVAALPDPRVPFAFEYCDGRLEVYLRTPVEAGIRHGGSLLAEFDLADEHAADLARCLVCGEENPTDPARPWCSKRCRNLLRSLGRERRPGVSDRDALQWAYAWALAERRERIGWYIPLTRQITESLYLLP